MTDAGAPGAGPTILLVVGYGRSGSTLLDVVLGNHPDVEGAGELVNLAGAGWIDDEYCACGRRVGSCDHWTAVRAALEEADPSFDPREYVRLEERIGRRGWRWSASEPTDALRRYGRQTLAVYSAIRTVSGASVIVDSSKSPERAIALSRVLASRLRLVHLVRDPRGVAWSLLKPLARDDASGVHRELPPRPAWRTSLRWSWVNAEADLASRRFPAERRATVRYEDLTADPARVLDVVGRVIEVDLGVVAKRLESGEEFTAGHQVAGNRLRMQGSIRLRADTEWRERLAPRDRAVVRALAGPLMWRYGYRG